MFKVTPPYSPPAIAGGVKKAVPAIAGGVKKAVWWVMAAVIFLIFGCSDDVKNPTEPPPVQILDIFSVTGTYGVHPNMNLHLGARVVNRDNEPQNGYRVNFSMTPDTSGTITPWAITDTTKDNGLNMDVIFNGSVLGVVLIRGWVIKADGTLASEDTMHVEVWLPGNY